MKQLAQAALVPALDLWQPAHHRQGAAAGPVHRLLAGLLLDQLARGLLPRLAVGPDGPPGLGAPPWAESAVRRRPVRSLAVRRAALSQGP